VTADNATTNGPTSNGSKSSSTTPLALVVSLGLAAAIALIVVTLAFSTSNTPSSIGGTSVTYSQYLPDGNK
jgi:hypothetical protein